MPMQKIMTFDEYVLSIYDTNGNGKIDRDGRGEYTAWKRALNNKNIANTRQGYAEYVALMAKINNQETAAQQQQAIITAATQDGNEAAAAVLTGETKGGTATKIVWIAAAAVVAIVLLIKRKQ